MNMNDCAIEYAKRGWRVFPCIHGLKIPFKKTRGVDDASNDPKTVESLFLPHPNANIALACGVGSGVYVVDVDVDTYKGINGFESLAARNITIPETLVQYTPRGGAHFLYHCNGEPPRNKNSLFPGVDIRGDGYYIMLAPSENENGIKYRWGNEGTPLAEFPEELKPQKYDKPIEIRTGATPAQIKGDRARIIERAIAYVDQCEPAIQGNAGHDQLLKVAAALCVGFSLSDSEALSIMWDRYNPRCVPPWDRGSKKDVRDFERKVREARKHPQQPDGYLLSEEDNRENEFSFAIGDAVAKNFLMNERKEIPLPVPINSDTPENRNAWTPEILRPDGLVGDICEWINSTAGCPQPKLALGASLTMCGALFGRKVRDTSDGRTNIYATGVAHSSSGKDHGADCVTRILEEAGAQDLIGGLITSDTAIERALSKCPVKFYCWDEVGHIFANINRADNSTSSYLSTIKPVLMRLFSSAHKLYIGKQKSGEDPIHIQNPLVCIWGMTSPEIFYSSITRSELLDGWHARNLAFISEDRPRYHIVPKCEIPEAIKNTVRAWYQRSLLKDGTTDILQSVPEMITVQMTEGAYRIFDKFGEEAYNNMIRLSHLGDATEFLWGKALQNARRIALIIAAGRNYDGAEITEYDAEYGVTLVRQLVYDFAEAVRKNLVENWQEKSKKRVEGIIKATESEGITKQALTRKTQWCKNRQARDAIIEDLEDAGIIVKVYTVGTRGRKIDAWVHADFIGAWAAQHKEEEEIKEND